MIVRLRPQFQIQCPRLSYFPLFLSRLHDFFAPSLINPDVPWHQGWLSFQEVPLKWHLPIGLLYDLFSGADPPSTERSSPTRRGGQRDNEKLEQSILPWKIVLRFNDWPVDHLIPLDPALKTLHDTFINSVKEADSLRYGEAKVIMNLSKEDSTKLWQAVQEHDITRFTAINNKFLTPPAGTSIRHVPVKIYLPSPPVNGGDDEKAQAGIRTVQGLVPPMLSSGEPQTLGTALHLLLPTVFPSRRAYIHAQITLHGAVAPLASRLQEMMTCATYADGFLHFAVVMLNNSTT